MLVGRIGRPGLLGTIARTAVVAGTAQMTANAINRRQQQRADEQQQAALYEQQSAAGAPANAAGGDLVDRLADLARLHETGSLSDEEFASAKRELLG